MALESQPLFMDNMSGRVKAITNAGTWALKGRWPLYGLFALLLSGPIALCIWAVELKVRLVALMSVALGCGLCALTGSLYSRLEAGNRFIEMSIDMFCTIGFDGFFKSLNPSWQKTLGFSTEELMSKPRTDFIHPDDRLSTKTEVDRLQNGEITLAFENRYLCKDGSYKWLLWNAVSSPKQRIIYAVARDITRRKSVEATLRESEDRYRKLFDLNPQPTWIYDRETLHFLAVNNAAVEKYGFSQEEFRSMTIRDLLPAEDIPDLLAAIAIPGEYGDCGIWQHRQKSGETIAVEVTSYSFLFDGRPADFVIAVDITERQRFIKSLELANQQLELRNREVERATQLKSRFLAGMSHDLRTPLNAIVGFSDLLADELPGPLNPKQKRFVNHIKQASGHLLQLIKDILDLSRIEAGQLELHCEEFDVDSLLPEVICTVRPMAMAKNINIQQRIETDAQIFADRVRFRQILYNLLSNALKFTPDNGNVEVNCYEQGDVICTSVSDTGIGISPENCELIFKEFRQVEGKSAASQEGAGLGLAITKGLVEQQGGRIWLESEAGKGSKFTFSLPKASPKEKAFAAASCEA
jgi:PAS domain S-box-containing protein